MDRLFPTGPIDRAVFDRLIEIAKNPWQPSVTLGVHECDLCQFAGNSRGNANLFIPSGDAIYVAPELIVHYISCHWFQPPGEFCNSVLNCPSMGSMEYLKAIHACGGYGLLRRDGDRE